jgi:aldehyde dehydrogenase (NAD+)
MRDYRKIYVNGEWIEPSVETVLDVINPANEMCAGQITLAAAVDVDRAVLAARAALASFARTTRKQRLDLLGSILDTYSRRHQDLADVLIEELGAPSEFAKNFQAAMGIVHLKTAIAALTDFEFEYPNGPRSTIRREPIGVVGMITPWNWAINQIMVKVVAALATGCTMVHKPSEVAPFTAHVLAEVLHDAGVPKGVYNLVDGDGPTVGAAIAGHRGIDMVSFTGSTAAGIDVARRAADNVKRVHTELGGKSPNIVLESADLKRAITENIYRLMLNSGQTCHAPTRLLVPAGRVEAAKAIAKEVAAQVSVGDPTTGVYMGPVVSKLQWDRVQSLIQAGIDEGAEVVTGGVGRPDGLGVGYYVKPTVFGDVTNDMEIARKEIFGPVLCIISYEDVDDAVAIANDSDFGLAAFVQAATDEEADAIAARLEVGMVYINGASEDPDAPFGGYKMSGNGREWGAFGFDEFLESKAVIHRDPLESTA